MTDDLSDLKLDKFHECPTCRRLIKEDPCLDCTEDPAVRAAWSHKSIPVTITKDRSHHPRST